MKKILLSILALSTFCSFSAFAQNLGQISEDRQPQNLKSAESFVKYANSREQSVNNSHSVARTGDALRSHRDFDDCDDFMFGLGGLGLGAWDLSLGWGLWPYTSSYFPYYGYYYPYYYGSYYYPYYYGSYYPYYWSQPNDSQQPRTTGNNHQTVATDRAHTPVVCFTSDQAGNWYANVDTAANAVKTQSALNQECAQAGGTCHQNLGCALATTSESNE